MITKSEAYTTSDGELHASMDDAIAHDLNILLDPIETTPTPVLCRALLEQPLRAKIIELLQQKG